MASIKLTCRGWEQISRMADPCFAAARWAMSVSENVTPFLEAHWRFSASNQSRASDGNRRSDHFYIRPPNARGFRRRTTSSSKVLERHWRPGGEYIFPCWRKFESQIAGGGSSSCSNKNRLEPLSAFSVFAHSFIRSKGYRASFLYPASVPLLYSNIAKSLIGPLSTLSDGSYR